MVKQEHRSSLAAAFLVLLLAAACGGTGSTSNGTTGGMMATGGTIGSGGMLGTGGTVSTGGTELAGRTTTMGGATWSGEIPRAGGTGGSGLSGASSAPPGGGGAGVTSAGGHVSTSDDAGTTTSVDASAAADAGDANSGPASIGDTSEDAGGATPGSIVSFTRGGQSLEVFAVPGQVMVFFRPEATADDVSQLIEGAGAVRLAAGSYGDRYLVQVPIGSEGKYIATVTGDSRVLDAFPNVISSDFSATILEGISCETEHADDVIAAFAAGSTDGTTGETVACVPVSLMYDPSGQGLSSTVKYIESDITDAIERATRLGGSGSSLYINASFGPNVVEIEWALCKENPTVCGPIESCPPLSHPCLYRAQDIAKTGLVEAWKARLRVLATRCGSSVLNNTCKAVLAMAAGNDYLQLDAVLAAVRDAGLANVLHANAVIVGVPLDLTRAWNGNYAPTGDDDFVLGANSAAVAEGGGTSFASPFVLGLTFRKANELRDPNDPDLTAVVDAEALCMVKKASTNRGKLADGDYGKISERCCLNRPESERAQDEKIHCCRPGQTWNANAQPPACECPAGQTWNAATNACEPKPDGGVCPAEMTVNPTSGKCVEVYTGTLTFCANACSGSPCLTMDCTTSPAIFLVDEQGEVTLPGSTSAGGITTTTTQTHNGPNFTITQTSQVAALQFTSTAVYAGTVTGDTIQGQFSSTGGEPGTTTTQTGTFLATRTSGTPDGGS